LKRDKLSAVPKREGGKEEAKYCSVGHHRDKARSGAIFLRRIMLHYVAPCRLVLESLYCLTHYDTCSRLFGDVAVHHGAKPRSMSPCLRKLRTSHRLPPEPLRTGDWSAQGPGVPARIALTPYPRRATRGGMPHGHPGGTAVRDWHQRGRVPHSLRTGG